MGALGGRRRREPSAAPGNPLDELLEEMRDLRLTLAADLTAAAAAAEAGADEVAGQILDADRVELARFARVADQRLSGLQLPAAAGPDAPRWRRRLTVALPVVPVVGALAFSAAAATGVLPLPDRGAERAPSVAAIGVDDSTPVSSTFREFVDLVGADPSASQLIAAADKLHRQLAELLASSHTDASSAARLAELLRLEQTLLLREQPPGAARVLHETRRLAARLVDVVSGLTKPTSVPGAVPTLDYDGGPRRQSDSTASPSPSPSKSTKSATSSPTPNPSASPSSDYEPPPLPTIAE